MHPKIFGNKSPINQSIKLNQCIVAFQRATAGARTTYLECGSFGANGQHVETSVSRKEEARRTAMRFWELEMGFCDLFQVNSQYLGL